MIELRWVWHNLEHGAPPTGAICVDTNGKLYQKLQYRMIVPIVDIGGQLCPSTDWSEWIDVPHSGVFHPAAKQPNSEPPAQIPSKHDLLYEKAKEEGRRIAGYRYPPGDLQDKEARRLADKYIAEYVIPPYFL